MVLYTKQAWDNFTMTAFELEGAITGAFYFSNYAMDNSDINLEINVVHMGPVSAGVGCGGAGLATRGVVVVFCVAEAMYVPLFRSVVQQCTPAIITFVQPGLNVLRMTRDERRDFVCSTQQRVEPTAECLRCLCGLCRQSLARHETSFVRLRASHHIFFLPAGFRFLVCLARFARSRD